MDEIDSPDVSELLKSDAFIAGLMRLLTIVVVFICLSIFLSSPWGDTLLGRIKKVETPWGSVDLSEPKEKLDKVSHDKAAETQTFTPGSENSPLTEPEKRQILTRVKLIGATLTNRRVLWADDNPTWSIREREFLRSLGIHFDLAQSNEAAEVLVSSYKDLGTPYDLIISDVHRERERCPIECGFALLEDLCRGEDVCETPLVFYTDSKEPKPTKAFAMTTYTVPFINYVLDALETKATSTPAVQSQILDKPQ